MNSPAIWNIIRINARIIPTSEIEGFFEYAPLSYVTPKVEPYRERRNLENYYEIECSLVAWKKQAIGT